MVDQAPRNPFPVDTHLSGIVQQGWRPDGDGNRPRDAFEAGRFQGRDWYAREEQALGRRVAAGRHHRASRILGKTSYCLARGQIQDDRRSLDGIVHGLPSSQDLGMVVVRSDHVGKGDESRARIARGKHHGSIRAPYEFGFAPRAKEDERRARGGHAVFSGLIAEVEQRPSD